MRQKTTLRKPVIKTLAVAAAAVSTMLFTSGPAMAHSIDNGDCNANTDSTCTLIHFKLSEETVDIDIVPLAANNGSPSCDSIKAGTDYYTRKSNSANFWFKKNYPYVAIRGEVFSNITILPANNTSLADCRGQGGRTWGVVPFNGINRCYFLDWHGTVFNYRGEGSDCDDK